jgi:PAS domain S-box-containing protein/putative nucleotidyltransferase with HDIG domain
MRSAHPIQQIESGLLAACPDAIIGCDSAGRITFVSRAASEILGLDSSALGMHISELFEDREHFANLAALLQAQPDGVHNYAAVLKGAEGHSFPALISAAPLAENQNGDINFVCFIRDNTFQQALEQLLTEQSAQLKESYDSILQALCAALDVRDRATEGHSRRVAKLAMTVARQLGIPADTLRVIEHAAVLHDIGKIGVADAVLRKPGPLSDEEWQEMRRHPDLGYRMIKDIGFLKEAAEIVHAHHERYDGKGYPMGLAGEAIPPGARIFAVVDAYDAITSDRPYRKARPHQKAIEEIVRNSGTQFDPQVVQAFLKADKRGLIRSKKLRPRPMIP